MKNLNGINRSRFGVTVDPRQELLAVGIEAGLQVMAQEFKKDVEVLCGLRYQRPEGRKGSRWGSTQGEVVLGGRKVSVTRPRVRSYAEELKLPSYEHYQAEAPLTERVIEQILNRVSTRRYPRTLEGNNLGLPIRGVSRSAISRRFILGTWQKIAEWLARPLDKLDLVAVLIDGVGLGEHTVVCAIGIDQQGKKHALGVWEGSTENAVVCQALLDNLVDRGLRTDRPMLIVIDGSKALRKAAEQTFGKRAVVQRCQWHKRQNVIAHLPKGMQTTVDLEMRRAYQSDNPEAARRILTSLAERLETNYPGAAASLREGLDETLTVIALNLPLVLRQSLQTTNIIESGLSIVRDVSGNVKNWRNGRMAVRWAATGLMVAEKRFRRIKGYRSLPVLVDALQRRNFSLDNRGVA
jgi:transposase-like protein